MEVGPIQTARLVLVPLSTAGIEAWLGGDRKGFEALTGLKLPRGGGIPPLLDDALPSMQRRLQAHPEEHGRWTWLFARAKSGELVGAGGFSGAPDARGGTLMGYSLYPHAQGHGYAAEAATALLEWALGAGGYTAVKATIPVGHRRSVRVAEKAGMRPIGKEQDPEVGEVLVYWRERGAAT